MTSHFPLNHNSAIRISFSYKWTIFLPIHRHFIIDRNISKGWEKRIRDNLFLPLFKSGHEMVYAI